MDISAGGVRSAVYPGSFDPVTNGHLDIIERSAKLFDRLYVSVLSNSAKRPMFSLEERCSMLRQTTRHIPNVYVDTFSGLLIDYARQKSCNVVIKGLRAISDFEYEFQMALMNRTLSLDVETLFMMTSSQYSFLSSSMVKEVAALDGDISALVPNPIAGRLVERLKESDSNR